MNYPDQADSLLNCGDRLVDCLGRYRLQHHRVAQHSFATCFSSWAKVARKAAIALLLSILAPLSANAVPGDLDPTFGSNGRISPIFGQFVGAMYGEDISLQSDGKLIIAAACSSIGTTQERFCAARRLPNGDPDPEFGLQGSGFISLGFRLFGTGNVSRVVKVAVQGDGKILLASTCLPELLCVVRLLSNGAPDLSFGADGLAIVRARVQSARLGAFALQRDGKIVLVGKDCAPAAGEAQPGLPGCVARLLPSGALDTAFGLGGMAFIQPPDTIRADLFSGAAIYELASGKLVIAGACNVPRSSEPDARDGCVLRLQSNGTPDTSFGLSGFVSIEMNSQRKMALPVVTMLQRGETLVIVGQCSENNSSLYDKVCVRSLDANSGFEGFPPASSFESISLNFLQALHPLRDGKVLVMGHCRAAAAVFKACLFRLHPDGSMDTEFPLTLDPYPGGSLANAAAVQRDGKVLVVTTYSNGDIDIFIGLSRHELGPSSASQCVIDIDGDGTFNPAIDGLILMRAIIGFTGSNVTAGITFTATAKRTQWGSDGENDLRKFLVSQCGLKLARQ